MNTATKGPTHWAGHESGKTLCDLPIDKDVDVVNEYTRASCLECRKVDREPRGEVEHAVD